jgi:hypothetical protein
MSAHNGDRSRFHRLRKAKIARRLRIRELRREVLAEEKPAAADESKSAKEK